MLLFSTQHMDPMIIIYDVIKAIRHLKCNQTPDPGKIVSENYKEIA